jgi:hypothetical protein
VQNNPTSIFTLTEKYSLDCVLECSAYIFTLTKIL